MAAGNLNCYSVFSNEKSGRKSQNHRPFSKMQLGDCHCQTNRILPKVPHGINTRRMDAGKARLQRTRKRTASRGVSLYPLSRERARSRLFDIQDTGAIQNRGAPRRESQQYRHKNRSETKNSRIAGSDLESIGENRVGNTEEVDALVIEDG